MTPRAVFLAAGAILTIVAACSSSSSPTTPTDAGSDVATEGGKDAGADTFKSECGQPGDVGNSLGVGKFCAQLQDCLNNGQATLCTTLGSSTNYYCTMQCTPGPNQPCGENASCACQGGQCGCHPDRCGGPIPFDAGPGNDAATEDAPSDAPAEGG